MEVSLSFRANQDDAAGIAANPLSGYIFSIEEGRRYKPEINPKPKR